jgi:hypothetical protein
MHPSTRHPDRFLLVRLGLPVRRSEAGPRPLALPRRWIGPLAYGCAGCICVLVAGLSRVASVFLAGRLAPRQKRVLAPVQKPNTRRGQLLYMCSVIFRFYVGEKRLSFHPIFAPHPKGGCRPERRHDGSAGCNRRIRPFRRSETPAAETAEGGNGAASIPVNKAWSADSGVRSAPLIRRTPKPGLTRPGGSLQRGLPCRSS